MRTEWATSGFVHPTSPHDWLPFQSKLAAAVPGLGLDKKLPFGLEVNLLCAYMMLLIVLYEQQVY